METSPSNEENCVLCSLVEGVPFYLDLSGTIPEGGKISTKRPLPTEEEVAAIGAIVCFLERGRDSTSSTWGMQARVEVLR